MAGTFARSRQLVAESWGVLQKDKELAWFPILSAIAATLVTLSFVVPLALTGNRTFLETDNYQPMHYVVLFAFYLVNYFVVTFFSAALTAAAYKRLTGGDPTFADGWSAAVKRLDRIFIWSLISATVGLILRTISERNDLARSIVAAILGAAWSILTLFVVPILIFEERGVIETMKESSALFRKTWGEHIVGGLGMGLVFFLLTLLGFVPLVLAFTLENTALIIGAIVVMVIYWLVLAVVSSSLNGIFLTALYIYARTGQVPAGFSPSLIQTAYTTKNAPLQPSIVG